MPSVTLGIAPPLPYQHTLPTPVFFCPPTGENVLWIRTHLHKKILFTKFDVWTLHQIQLNKEQFNIDFQGCGVVQICKCLSYPLIAEKLTKWSSSDCDVRLFLIYFTGTHFPPGMYWDQTWPRIYFKGRAWARALFSKVNQRRGAVVGGCFSNHAVRLVWNRPSVLEKSTHFLKIPDGQHARFPQ